MGMTIKVGTSKNAKYMARLGGPYILKEHDSFNLNIYLPQENHQYKGDCKINGPTFWSTPSPLNLVIFI